MIELFGPELEILTKMVLTTSLVQCGTVRFIRLQTELMT